MKDLRIGEVITKEEAKNKCQTTKNGLIVIDEKEIEKGKRARVF